MPEKSLTDGAYESIERVEGRKKWMVGVVIACFILAPIGLGFGVFAIDHQKGGITDLASNPLIVITALVSIIVLAFGTNRFILIKKWEKQLGRLEQLEKTIYQEVLSSREIN
jgi:hypothetical protein